MNPIPVSGLLVSWITTAALASHVLAQSRSFESNIGERNVNGQVVQSERDEQESLFNYYFRKQDLTFDTKLEDLRDEATVPSWRIPYSAAIHPESAGGLSDAGAGGPGPRGRRRGGLFGMGRLRASTDSADPHGPRNLLLSGPMAATGNSPLGLYDRAFHGGRNMANDYEVRRIMTEQRGLIFRRTVSSSESWEGYCSGFTASTIRHPEPVKSVNAGDFGGTPGVILRPTDIKALLSCIYNRTSDDSFLFLAPPSASDGGPNMGTFHLALANYIGKGGTPIGIDRSKGRVAWNNPVYAYKVNSMRDAGESDGIRFRGLQTTITYSSYGQDGQRQTDLETGDRVGNRKQSMTIRYVLALNEAGEIIGGRALTSAGHFLWIPLFAAQAQADGSVPGNPYIDVKKVIAVARASALPGVQKKFDRVVIGPTIGPALDAHGETRDTLTNSEADDS